MDHIVSHYLVLKKTKSEPDSISNWLQPPDKIIYANPDPLYAIKRGLRWDPQYLPQAREGFSEFRDRPWLDNFLLDLAKYPWQPRFGEPEILLRTYLGHSWPEKYFSETTGQDYFEFLNETERIFFLLHGYGRPNPHLSAEDYRLRRFFFQVRERPTCLLPLTTWLDSCPKPSTIMERLSLIRLESLPVDLLTLVQDIFWYAKDLRGLNIWLKKHGYHQAREYDIKERCFVCSLPEYQLYQLVNPRLSLKLTNTKGYSTDLVGAYLCLLSDQELMTWVKKPFVTRQGLVEDCLGLFEVWTRESTETGMRKIRRIDQREETYERENIRKEWKENGTISCTIEDLEYLAQEDEELQGYAKELRQSLGRVRKFLGLLGEGREIFHDVLKQTAFPTCLEEVDGLVLELPCWAHGQPTRWRLQELTQHPELVEETRRIYLAA